MIFTNRLLYNTPVIEFQIQNGKIFQLVSKLETNSFGPLKSELNIIYTKEAVTIELLPSEDDKYTIGIFYNQFGFRCSSPKELIFREFRAKLKVAWYHPVIGFYRLGAEIICPEWNKLAINNKILRKWEFTEHGWITKTKDNKGIITLN
jgi:hypothetical protein